MQVTNSSSSGNPSEIALRIRQARGDLTQAEFAAQLGVASKTVIRWEQGVAIPDGESLLALNAVFEARPTWVLTGAERPPPLDGRAAVLLDNYRRAGESGQRAIESTAAALAGAGSGATALSALPKRRASVVIHGDVGQQIKGDVHNTAPFSINVGASGKPKR